MAVPAVGDLAPAFSAADVDGARHSLATALESGPVVLCFFKSECGTSELALPFVEKVWRANREHASPEGMRLSVWGVSQDDADTTRDFAKTLDLSFPLLLDDAGFPASRAYDIEATPTVFLLEGREKLRRDSHTVDADEARRVLGLMEGWNREAFSVIVDEIAARIGNLPAEPFEGNHSVPDRRPG